MTIELKNYILKIFVKDSRTALGEHLFSEYNYYSTHPKWMREEVKYLENTLYTTPRYRITLQEVE